MKIKKYLLLFTVFSSFAFAQDQSNEMSAQTYYTYASEAFNNENWMNVINYSKVLVKHYPNSPLTKEVSFYLGVAYFNLKDFELANRYFSRYLKNENSPRFFEEGLMYKFEIAQKFKNGAKKHAFSSSSGPKVINASEDALAIFEEIINTLPNHELACKSLFEKALLQITFEDYKESIDTFKTLINKFTKNELAIQSYVEISKVYLKQTTVKHQNLDVLEAAYLNLSKFEEAFPESEKLKETKKNIFNMEEKFAKGFLEIADFYLKTKKLTASKMYYAKIVNQFPNSTFAIKAQTKLDKIEKNEK
ncbi:MAG: Outer membrane protein assembly factor BamD [Candidatus Anoxychlamydiales bacterium]|nr:Outer membrane protein assembly factor BamD [Candidatus Anoxychlamydiales bacterium]